MGRKTRCANGNARMPYLRIRPLRTFKDFSLGRNGVGNWNTENTLFEPRDCLLHLIPGAITSSNAFSHPAVHRNRKGRFRREEVEGFRDAVFSRCWQATLARGPASLLNQPQPLCFFLGDSQLVTVPGRRGLTSGTEFILFYFSISQNRSCWAALEWSHKNIPAPLEVHVNIIIERDKIVCHFWNNINGDLQTKNKGIKNKKTTVVPGFIFLTFITARLMERCLGENVNYRFTSSDRKTI